MLGGWFARNIACDTGAFFSRGPAPRSPAYEVPSNRRGHNPKRPEDFGPTSASLFLSCDVYVKAHGGEGVDPATSGVGFSRHHIPVPQLDKAERGERHDCYRCSPSKGERRCPSSLSSPGNAKSSAAGRCYPGHRRTLRLCASGFKANRHTGYHYV